MRTVTPLFSSLALTAALAVPAIGSLGCGGEEGPIESMEEGMEELQDEAGDAADEIEDEFDDRT